MFVSELFLQRSDVPWFWDAACTLYMLFNIITSTRIYSKSCLPHDIQTKPKWQWRKLHGLEWLLPIGIAVRITPQATKVLENLYLFIIDLTAISPLLLWAWTNYSLNNKSFPTILSNYIKQESPRLKMGRKTCSRRSIEHIKQVDIYIRLYEGADEFVKAILRAWTKPVHQTLARSGVRQKAVQSSRATASEALTWRYKRWWNEPK